MYIISPSDRTFFGLLRMLMQISKSCSALGYYNNFDLLLLNSDRKSLVQQSGDYSFIFKLMECLFCCARFNQVSHTLQHMKRAHSFNLKYPAYIVDINGLLKHLSSIIELERCCLHCNKGFPSADQVRQHMIAKGHCFMPWEEFGYLNDYYDFSEYLLRKIMNLPDEKSERFDFVDFESQTNTLQNQSESHEIIDFEESFEVLNSNTSSLEESFQQINQVSNLEVKRELMRQLLKQIQENKAKLMPTGELLLPNGKILGCRALLKYYRQRTKLREKRI